MIRHVIGNLFDGEVDIIAHQVNCRGAMGSGVARQVRELFPNVYDEYRKKSSYSARRGMNCLGQNQYVETVHKDRHIIVANMFAQQSYGYDGKLYTDYAALRSCLKALRNYTLFFGPCKNGRIGLPYLIGCDRGGGDWNTVYQIICEELHDCNVTLFELPKE